MNIKINGHCIYDKMDVKMESLKPVISFCRQEKAFELVTGAWSSYASSSSPPMVRVSLDPRIL